MRTVYRIHHVDNLCNTTILSHFCEKEIHPPYFEVAPLAMWYIECSSLHSPLTFTAYSNLRPRSLSRLPIPSVQKCGDARHQGSMVIKAVLGHTRLAADLSHTGGVVASAAKGLQGRVKNAVASFFSPLLSGHHSHFLKTYRPVGLILLQPRAVVKPTSRYVLFLPLVKQRYDTLSQNGRC